MENKMLNKDIISRIFHQNNIADVYEIQKMNIGFTNDIYLVNNRYILKVCVNEENEGKFNKESFCYDLFKDRIPVPHIIISDTSKRIIDKYYMIYEKIAGDNLYAKWHLFNDRDRKCIIHQLADIIHRINTAEYTSFLKHFHMGKDINWHDLRYNSLKDRLHDIRANQILDDNFIRRIEQYIHDNHTTLYEQKLALTYTDLHFDNVLISGNEVTALLDFEGVDVFSIDYALGTIKRLTEYPYLYACEAYEKFVSDNDYAHIMEWFRELCPDLFDFKHLDIRLALYSIEYDMGILLRFPKAEDLKERLAKTIQYEYNGRCRYEK